MKSCWHVHKVTEAYWSFMVAWIINQVNLKFIAKNNSEDEFHFMFAVTAPGLNTLKSHTQSLKMTCLGLFLVVFTIHLFIKLTILLLYVIKVHDKLMFRI